MTLVLTITNVERLDTGESTRLVLDRHGAKIGRSPHMDWSLPDPRSHVSSHHCDIDFQGGTYRLIDKSTNGTYVNGDTIRLAAPHVIADGDEITIGHYCIAASLAGGGLRTKPQAEPPAGGWGDWQGQVPQPESWNNAPLVQADRPPQSDWGAEEPMSSPGWRSIPADPVFAAPPRQTWDPQPAETWGPPEDQSDTWVGPAAAVSGRGPMSGHFEPPAPVAADDFWSRIAETNEVDWTRGGFGQPAPVPPAVAHSQPQAPQRNAPPSDGGAWATLMAAAGLTPDMIKGAPAEAGRAAGLMLRLLIGGMVVLMEARARDKSEMGVVGTIFERDGNNPLKFTRSPDRALAQLINPAEQGFMPAERAVEAAFKDLQAHHKATLMAMQGALRSTLDRFSPSAIRQRAETRGLLARILPSAREAELWRAYEREFEGVVRGSDEAFMDVFAKAFREAYERAAKG